MPDDLSPTGPNEATTDGDAVWQRLARRALTDGQASFYNAVSRCRQPLQIELTDGDGRAADGSKPRADESADGDTDTNGADADGTGAEDSAEQARNALTVRFCWRAEDPAGPLWIAQLQTRAGTLDLYLSDEIVRALLDRRCGTASFARMDETSRQVVVEYALQPLIAGLSPAEITGCSIAKHEDTDGPWSRSAFRVDADCDLKDGGSGPVGIATAAPAVANALRRKIEGLSLAVANDGAFTAPLIIHAGQTRMRRQDLESLAVTDVILVEQSALEDAKAIVKVAGTSIAYFVEVGQYSLTTLERLNGAADKINQPTEQDMSELEETGDIEVDVVFEIGRLDISLEELATLGPGHVFTLGRPLDIAVTIRANNARIGTGDIVFVDDRVGIQISKLKSSD